MSHRWGLALAGAALTLATFALDAAAAEEAKATSGPAVGSSTPQFDHHGITGMWKGDPKVCYV